MSKAKLIGISRLRIGTDGHGVTTLVAFHGCPLRCKYCLNPQCWDEGDKCLELSPEEVYNKVKKDELYFISTGGGITFGGGEPLLQSQFIKEVLELGAKNWHTTIETSLNVAEHHLERLVPYIDQFIVDIKDMDIVTYREYTGERGIYVYSNLLWIKEQGLQDKVTIRIPHIPDFNTKENQLESKRKLKAMGFSKFDLFEYKKLEHDSKYFQKKEYLGDDYIGHI